jgi:hypothetical protein
MTAFWYIAPCRLVEVNRRFRRRENLKCRMYFSFIDFVKFPENPDLLLLLPNTIRLRHLFMCPFIEAVVCIVTNLLVLFHNGSLLHSEFNTQLLIVVHNSSRILTHV